MQNVILLTPIETSITMNHTIGMYVLNSINGCALK